MNEEGIVSHKSTPLKRWGLLSAYFFSPQFGHKSGKMHRAGNSKASLEDTLKDNALLGAFDSQTKRRKQLKENGCLKKDFGASPFFSLLKNSIDSLYPI
jgi:hypothetical protein